MDTQDKPLKVINASDITEQSVMDAVNAAATIGTPFDKGTNEKLDALEKETDAAISDPNTQPGSLKNGSFKVNMNDPLFRKLLKRAIAEHKARTPPHENCTMCRKYCPLFKKNACFKKTAAEQLACWKAAEDDLRQKQNIHTYVKAIELNRMIGKHKAEMEACDDQK